MNTSINKKENLYLIAGATGNVGRHLVSELTKQEHHVRALTRNPQNASFPDQVEVVEGDLTRPRTLVDPFEGVTSLHLITINGDSFEPLDTAPELVKLAEEAGVQRVTVLWSGFEGPVERAVKASNLEWTILQPQEFMSNTLEWAQSIREKGVVREAFGNRKTAMIHESDIARVAAAALTEEGHTGKEYTLTGPEVLTPTGAARIIGEVVGREVRFEELTEEQALKEMLQSGIEEETAEFVLSWHRDTPEEGYTVVPIVEEVTGRRPRTFRQWVEEHAKIFKKNSNS